MGREAENEATGERRSGFRFGPFVLVPEILTTPDDPWAHRKGEPRILALLWAIYLMIGALLTIFGVASLGTPSPNRYEYACRAMLIIVGVGLSVLWPMTRLSQSPPRRPVRAMLADAASLLAPTQAVILPMKLLTDWPMDLVFAISLSVIAWTMLAGVVVAHGSASTNTLTRAALMALTVIVVAAAPTVWLASGASSHLLPQWWGMLSPVTAPISLTNALPGHRPAMSDTRWWLAATPLLAAITLLLAVPTRRPQPAGRDPRDAPR